jgi:hypothetical protein
VLDKIYDHKDRAENQELKVFELKNSVYSTDKISPLRHRSPLKVEKYTDQLPSKLRSLRYKNYSHSSSEHYWEGSKTTKAAHSSIKTTQEEYLFNAHSIKNSDSGSFSSNMVSSGEGYIHRRKQPRQSRKYLDYSRDKDSEHHSNKSPYKYIGANGLDSDEELDSINNEEIGEQTLEEVQFRQPVHHTKSTLRLLKINSEGSPKVDIPRIPEISSLKNDKSLDRSHGEYVQFEPNSDPRGQIYNSIRNISPMNKSREFVSREEETFSKIYSYHEEPFKIIQPTSTQSTKPLALRKRNRDPYNPYPENMDYLKYNLPNDEENWPRTKSNLDIYQLNKDIDYPSRNSGYEINHYPLEQPQNLTSYADREYSRRCDLASWERDVPDYLENLDADPSSGMHSYQDSSYYDRQDYVAPSNVLRRDSSRDRSFQRYDRDRSYEKQSESTTYVPSRRKMVSENYSHY